MLTVFALPLALAALTVGEAPEARFAVKGRVLDASGAPIAQARVMATSADQRSTPATATDSSGAFTLVLPPGSYSLKVVAPGFLEIVAGRRPLSPTAATRASSS